MSKATHHCESCGKDGGITKDHTCKHCKSEDIFDMRLPEWPCQRCREYTALYKAVCVECQKTLLASAIAQTIFGEEDAVDFEDEEQFNPKEDYGAPGFRAFDGNFPKDIRRFGDPR